jgi:hypothetical protein
MFSIEQELSVVLKDADASMNRCDGDFCVFHDFSFASRFYQDEE